MKELIKELAKKAYIEDASKYPGWTYKPGTEVLLKQLEGFSEKFAELIIQECLNIAIQEEHWTPQQGPVESKIKEHFGVESTSQIKPTIRVYGWVWKDKRHEDGCCYVPSYTPATPCKNGELLALVDPNDLNKPLENTHWR